MKKIIFMVCIVAVMSACKKEQQIVPVKSVIEGGLSITIEKGQLSNDNVVYNQTPAWLSVWNTSGHVLDIMPTDALQGITNDKTTNKTITADYHN
ncbi:MAG TPA: hypothetical protein VNW51_09405, partial [Mucilaginibacter sp.]|nr:hypothetical protein [Mucilaginibacter sp.]